MHVEHGISDETLLRELEDLKQVDWPNIWKGPPSPIEPGFKEWCARYGWEPQTVEFNLIVTTRHGTRFTLYSPGGGWDPIYVFTFSNALARVSASVPEENTAVVDRGVAELKRYGELISQVWGSPTGSGSAPGGDYPESPMGDPDRWSMPDSPRGNPYGVAYWSPPSGGDGPVVVLDQGVSIYTWEPDMTGASVVSLEFYPPAWLNPYAE